MRSEDATESSPRAVADESFEEFFRRQYAVVARASMLVVRDADLGREIAQEAFTRLYERWGQMTSPDHARGFVFKVAPNLGRSHLRRSKRLSLFGLRPTEGRISGQAPEVTADRLLIRDALSTLSPRQRASLVLVDYVGLDAASAGRILRMRPSTVYVHLSRGRRRLSAQGPDDT